jgi:hypothetical protein
MGRRPAARDRRTLHGLFKYKCATREKRGDCYVLGIECHVWAMSRGSDVVGESDSWSRGAKQSVFTPKRPALAKSGSSWCNRPMQDDEPIGRRWAFLLRDTGEPISGEVTSGGGLFIALFQSVITDGLLPV